MLDAYSAKNERLTEPVTGPEGIADAVWIDLLQPTREEEALVERLLGHRHSDARGDGRDRGLVAPLPRERRALHDRQPPRRRRRPDAAELPRSPSSSRASVWSPSAMPSRASSRSSAAGAEGRLQPQDRRRRARRAARGDHRPHAPTFSKRPRADIDAVSRNVFQTRDEASKPVSRDYKAMLRQVGRSGDLNSQGARKPGQPRPAGEFPHRRMRRRSHPNSASARKRCAPISAR